MKKLEFRLLTLVALMTFSLATFAQKDKKDDKALNEALEKAYAANAEIINRLDAQWRELSKSGVDLKTVERLEKRIFKPTGGVGPEAEKWMAEKLDKELNKKVSLADVFADKKLVTDLSKVTRQSSRAWAYKEIVAMHNSLADSSIYDKSVNERLKGEINHIDSFVLDAHKAEFKTLCSQINDYRFSSFELLRVMDLVDKNNKARTAKELTTQLSRDGELDYIITIPSTKAALEKYIELKFKNDSKGDINVNASIGQSEGKSKSAGSNEENSSEKERKELKYKWTRACGRPVR